MRFLGVVCFSVILAAGFLCGARANPAAQLVDQLNQQRENLFRMVTEGLMQKSSFISNFNQSLTTIRQRFDEAKQSGDLDDLDEGEQSALYYRIVIDEIRNLKKRFVVEGGNKISDAEAADLIARIDDAPEMQGVASKQQAYDSMEAIEEEEEEELENELEQMDKLDRQLDYLDKEAEMGWGLDHQSKANLQARTKNVLGDLLANELKTLVSIIVTTYIGGTPSGALGPAIAALNVSIKGKVFEFVMHSVMDLLAGLCGRKIEKDMKPINFQLGGAVSAQETAPHSNNN